MSTLSSTGLCIMNGSSSSSSSSSSLLAAASFFDPRPSSIARFFFSAVSALAAGDADRPAALFPAAPRPARRVAIAMAWPPGTGSDTVGDGTNGADYCYGSASAQRQATERTIAR